MVVSVISYTLGALGIKIILAKNGLFLWNFWFGSIYSFTASDFAQTYLGERLLKKYAKYQILRFVFFIIAIYVSGEASVAYQTTFSAFLESPSTQPYIGYWILGLSAGAFDTAYGYFRLKYRKEYNTTAPEPRT